MKYCKTCVLPDTRPGLTFNDQGVCCACEGHTEKNEAVDWASREREFDELVKSAKARGAAYDCIVPASGGKDSTYQVVKCLEHGLRILAVTWRTPARTEIGQQNLDNLRKLPIDHIDFSINPDIERRFMYKTLEAVGDTALPMHFAIFSIPLRIAESMNVPLVIWGENPHMEYGGTPEERRRNMLDHQWMRSHGILHGTTTADWVGGDLTEEDLGVFTVPDESVLHHKEIRSLFIGYFFSWDPEETQRVAEQHGFRVSTTGPKVGYYDYADIDCDFISVHHYFKWLKFGFTRLFDNLSLEIRNGRITREQAVEIIAQTGDQRPDEDISKICRFLQISEDRFWEIAETFRNAEVWTKKGDTWVIEDFLIRDWEWK